MKMFSLEVLAYFRAHHGMATHAALSRAGLSRRQRHAAVEVGVLEQMYADVVHLASTPLTLEARCAAISMAYPRGFVTGPAGGRLMGLRRMPKNKTVAALQRKLERAKQQLAKGGSVNIGKRKAEKHKLLGSLGRAFSVKASSSQATVTNNVPFSGVLLEGGTVGNGAWLPARRYLEVSSDVRRRLADITLEHFLRR